MNLMTMRFRIISFIPKKLRRNYSKSHVHQIHVRVEINKVNFDITYIPGLLDSVLFRINKMILHYIILYYDILYDIKE